MLDQFGNARYPGRDSGDLQRHRLDQGVGDAVAVAVLGDDAGQNKDLRLVQVFPQLLLEHRASQMNAFLEPGRRDQLLELARLRPLPDDDAPKRIAALREQLAGLHEMR